jgi:hypothetical protein
MGQNFIKQYKKTILVSVFLILFLVITIPLGKWLKFHNPKMTLYEYNEADVNAQPVQKMYKYELSQSKIFEYKSLYKNITARITPVAYYKIQGLVVAHNTYFPLKTGFDYVALYDIGLVWDKLAQGDFFKNNCKAQSEQFIEEESFFQESGVRGLFASCTNHDETLKQIGYTWMDFDSHISHTHIIPANVNIMAALNTIKNYDKVELEGEIVNVKVRGHEHISSLERNDDNGSAQGGGACEIMYVTRVKVGHKIYQ